METFLNVSMIFTILVFILNIFEELNFFKEMDVNFFVPISLTLLNLPSIVYDIFPFIFLITTQFFFIKISEKNELLIFKNIGVTNFKILRLTTYVTLIAGIIIITVFYHFSSKFKFFYFDIKNNFSKDNKYLAVVTNNGLWIKDEIDNTINIISANKINKNFLENVNIIQFNKEFELIKNIESKKIDIQDKNWIIYNAKISKDNFETKNVENLYFKTNFDSEKINSLFSNLSSLTILELNKLKKDYRNLGQSTLDIDTHKQKIYSYPIYLMIMSLFSGIIMLNIKHNKPKIFHLILGIMLSVLIYYINFFSSLLGENGKIPVLMSIWLPLLILFLLSCIGLVRVNEK